MKLLKGIIDHFEENIAVVEIEGVTRDFKKSIFPETEKRRKEIEDLMDELWED